MPAKKLPWDARSGKMLRELKAHGSTVFWSAAFSPDGSRIVISRQNRAGVGVR
jgi:hypothetical protein